MGDFWDLVEEYAAPAAGLAGAYAMTRSSGGGITPTVTSSKVTPAPLDADGQAIWDEFMGMLFGSGPPAPANNAPAANPGAPPSSGPSGISTLNDLTSSSGPSGGNDRRETSPSAGSDVGDIGKIDLGGGITGIDLGAITSAFNAKNAMKGATAGLTLAGPKGFILGGLAGGFGDTAYAYGKEYWDRLDPNDPANIMDRYNSSTGNDRNDRDYSGVDASERTDRGTRWA